MNALSFFMPKLMEKKDEIFSDILLFIFMGRIISNCSVHINIKTSILLAMLNFEGHPALQKQ